MKQNQLDMRAKQERPGSRENSLKQDVEEAREGRK